MVTAGDRGESVSAMEPLLISRDSRHRPALTDLAVELVQRSAGFRRSLPDSLTSSLANLSEHLRWLPCCIAVADACERRGSAQISLNLSPQWRS